MRIVPFSEVSPSDWNIACETSSDAWLFHRHEWISLEAARLGASNVSFAIERSGRLVGVVPFYNSKLPLGPFVEDLHHTGIHRHSGIAVVDSLSRLDRSEAEKLALATIISLATDAGSDRVQLCVQNASPRWRPGQSELIPFWASSGVVHFGLYSGPNGVIPVPQLSTLALDQFYDLSVDPATPVDGISSSARTAARKAVNHGVHVRMETTHGHLDTVLEIAERSSRRTGEAAPDVAYFNELLAGESSRHVTTLLALDSSSNPIGALVLAVYKDVAHFLHGYSDPESLDLRVNDFLHLSAIEWARGEGLDFYRLGPFFPEVPPDWPISKVSRFKTKFANTSVPIRQGSIFVEREKYVDLGRGIFEAN